MCGKIEMEVLFSNYTANYLTLYSQMIYSVLSKWHFHFYLSAYSDFGFFSCLDYLHPKEYIEGVKNKFLNLVGYMMHQVLSTFLLSMYSLDSVKPFEEA